MRRPSRLGRRGPEYLRMLGAIVVSYAIIIGLGDAAITSPVRVALLTYLVWTSARLHGGRGLRWTALIAGGVALALTIVFAVMAAPRALTTAVGGLTVIFVALAMVATASALVARWRVDTSTVLGVLCIYLMFALLFAGLHQVFAGFVSPYLNGVDGHPDASDLLYFSVITITTTGFGDITPAAESARAITVIEAITGQLYLVSVVAGVVAGWRATDRPPPPGSDLPRS